MHCTMLTSQQHPVWVKSLKGLKNNDFRICTEFQTEALVFDVDIGHHVSWLTVNACSIYQGTLLHLRPTALQCSWLRRAHLLRVIVKRDRRICPFGTILDPRLNVIVIKGAQHNDWDLRLLQRYSQLYTLLQRRRKIITDRANI